MKVKTKEELIRSIENFGAVKDENVENVWWYGGHCMLVKRDPRNPENYILEEL